jgi:hypothetical protein
MQLYLLLLGFLYKYLFSIISVNTANKVGISSMKITDVGVDLTYLM